MSVSVKECVAKTSLKTPELKRNPCKVAHEVIRRRHVIFRQKRLDTTALEQFLKFFILQRHF